ncbi:TPA: hypothetical protein ACH3X3_014045 [Trebouxia sp. C0006]
MSSKMEVHVGCQKFEVEDSIKTVRAKFAKMFGVHPSSCQLYYHGDQLADQPLRQVQPNTLFAKLTAMFPYTLALSMWQTFAVGHGDINTAVPELWQAAADAFAADKN